MVYVIYTAWVCEAGSIPTEQYISDISWLRNEGYQWLCIHIQLPWQLFHWLCAQQCGRSDWCKRIWTHMIIINLVILHHTLHVQYAHLPLVSVWFERPQGLAIISHTCCNVWTPFRYLSSPLIDPLLAIDHNITYHIGINANQRIPYWR